MQRYTQYIIPDTYHYIRNYQRVLSDILQIKHFIGFSDSMLSPSLIIHANRIVEYGVWNNGTCPDNLYDIYQDVLFCAYRYGSFVSISHKFNNGMHYIVYDVTKTSKRSIFNLYDQLGLIKQICNERKLNISRDISYAASQGDD